MQKNTALDGDEAASNLLASKTFSFFNYQNVSNKHYTLYFKRVNYTARIELLIIIIICCLILV